MQATTAGCMLSIVATPHMLWLWHLCRILLLALCLSHLLLLGLLSLILRLDGVPTTEVARELCLVVHLVVVLLLLLGVLFDERVARLDFDSLVVLTAANTTDATALGPLLVGHISVSKAGLGCCFVPSGVASSPC